MDRKPTGQDLVEKQISGGQRSDSSPCHIGSQRSYLHQPHSLKISFNPKEDEMSGPSPPAGISEAVSIPGLRKVE